MALPIDPLNNNFFKLYTSIKTHPNLSRGEENDMESDNAFKIRARMFNTRIPQTGETFI